MKPIIGSCICIPILAASAMLAPHAAAEPLEDCTVIRVAIEMDSLALNNEFGGDLVAANEYIDTLITSVDEIFRRELGIGVVLTHAKINRTTDDDLHIWAIMTRSEYLHSFRDAWEDKMVHVRRDVAILLSDLSVGALEGGIAFANGICTPEKGYAVVLSLRGLTEYPLLEQHEYNRDVGAFAHELAHSIGGTHTHELGLSVPGCMSDPDDCFGFPGTILSYCHTCTDSGTYGDKIKLTFCPENIELMQARLAEISCLQPIASEIDVVDDIAETLENTCKYIDVLQNDHATCSLVEFSEVPPFSTYGGKVLVSEGTGEFGRDRILYYPPPGFIGTDSFAYFAQSAEGNYGSAAVLVDVMPQPYGGPDYLVLDASDRSVRRFHAISDDELGHLVMGNYSILTEPRSIAVLPNNDVIIGETANIEFGDYMLNWVLAFDGEHGTSKGVFFQDARLQEPEAIVVGTEWVWILDGTDGQIFRTDHAGEANVQLVDPAMEVTAYDMALDEANGQLWVSRKTSGIWEVRAFDMLTGERGLGINVTGTFNSPGALLVRDDGIIEVGDRQFGFVVGYDTQTGAQAWESIDIATSYEEGIGGALEFVRGPKNPAWPGQHGLAATGGAFRLHDPTGVLLGPIAYAASDKLQDPVAIAYRPLGRPTGLAGDLNDDGRVNGEDLAGVLGDWGRSGAGDANRDGRVDGEDLAMVLGAWTG